MRARLFVFATLLIGGCSASGRALYVADASPDVVVITDASSLDANKKRDGANVFADAADLTGRTCERSIDVGSLSISSPTCFVNEHVSNRSGTLTFPCEGGDAKVTFSGKAFEGTVDGDEIEIELVEPFIFNSCQWESTETIEGDLKSGKLVYRYSERPLAACTDTPCTGDGTLDVESGEVVVVK